jgi:hypothetical protein
MNVDNFVDKSDKYYHYKNLEAQMGPQPHPTLEDPQPIDVERYLVNFAVR